MDIDLTESQISLIIVFFTTLSTSLLQSFVKRLWSRRRHSDNVFNVSDSNSNDKTCMRHKKKCRSSEFLVLQILNFFIGGLLFALLVLRLLPLTYRQFDSIYNFKCDYNFSNTVVNEDNIIVFNEQRRDDNKSESKPGLPYVELIVFGFFFVVYFIEQLIQALTGWDGWHNKSSFVQLPAVKPSNTTIDKRKSDENKTTSAGEECSEPSLVACYRKVIEDEITEFRGKDVEEEKENQEVQQIHKPDCPLANSSNGVNSANSTINRRLHIPCRPSRPASIIIVLPSAESSDVSTTWLQLKIGLSVISSVSVHQLSNGVTLALQTGYWCWLALVVILCHSILTAIMMTSKLMKECCDSYIKFLCQLIFSSLMPLGIIISSVLKITSFTQLLLMGLSSGATFHLVFMTLLQSERCTRLAGLIQYLSMYSGFTLVLCFVLLIGNK